jgi:hypothetical protein
MAQNDSEKIEKRVQVPKAGEREARFSASCIGPGVIYEPQLFESSQLYLP